MKKICSGTLLLLLFAIAEISQGRVMITYSSSGTEYFSMAIADGWTVNVGSEQDLEQTRGDKREPARLISAMPNDGMPLWFGMWVPEDLQKIEETRDYLASLGLDLLSEVEITEQKYDRLGSMDVHYISGTGTKDNELMDFKAGFFQLSQAHVAIAIYIGPPETTSEHLDELTSMIRSLNPLVKDKP